jgi:DNA polymerase-3 subunit delta
MKLTYAQLETHLAKQLAASYVISGDELFLKQDVVFLLRKAAKKAGFNERIRLSHEACADAKQLYAALYSTSLFTEKRLVELDFGDHLPNKAISTILQTYAEQPASDTILLLEMGKLDDKTTKNAWYKIFDKIGMTLALWPIPREQLPQWIQQRAHKYKLQFTQDALRLLADYVEGNLIAAAQTMEKIYLLQPKQAVDIELLQNILTDQSQFSIFDFIDSLLAGKSARSLHILENLKADGVEPTLILWAITRELRLLAEFAKQIAQGAGYEQLFQKQRVFFKRQPLIRQFLTRFSAKDCWQQLHAATEIDQIIKGVYKGNVWNSLELFCLRLS